MDTLHSCSLELQKNLNKIKRECFLCPLEISTCAISDFSSSRKKTSQTNFCVFMLCVLHSGTSYIFFLSFFFGIRLLFANRSFVRPRFSAHQLFRDFFFDY